jgi:tripartite-type tricarboxylate transporter receptor subunit TctC
MVVPYPAGGVLDSSARIIGRKLGEYLGQQIVIDNRPGASGTLGDAVVARAEPDGYTLLLTSGDFIIIWNGVFAPAGTPAAILDRLGKELTRAAHDPEIREALNKAGIDAESIVQPAFGERIRSDAARYKDIIEKTGIKISR